MQPKNNTITLRLITALAALIEREEREAAEAGETDTPWLNEARRVLKAARR